MSGYEGSDAEALRRFFRELMNLAGQPMETTGIEADEPELEPAGLACFGRSRHFPACLPQSLASSGPQEPGASMLRQWWKRIAAKGSVDKPTFSSGGIVLDDESVLADDLKQRGFWILDEHVPITSISGSGQVGDDDLATLIACRSLKDLDLQNSPITDDGMVHIGKITTLARLHLGYTSVTASGLAHLRSLKALRSLDLTGTSIVIEDAAEHLAAVTSLRWLDLRMTPKTEASAAAIDYLRRRNRQLEFHPSGLS